jgi:hypothetical protein
MARIPLKSNQHTEFAAYAGLVPGILRGWIRSTTHRLPETLVGITAIIVFGALFLHVFRDLLSPEMLILAPSAVSRATWAGVVLIILGGVILTRRTAATDVTLGWGDFGRLKGLPHHAMDAAEQMAHISAATITGAITGAVAIAAGRTVIHSGSSKIIVFVGALGACLMATWRQTSEKKRLSKNPTGKTKPTRFSSPGRTVKFPLVSTRPVTSTRLRPVPALVRWRTGQILRMPVTWWICAAWVLMQTVVLAGCLSNVPLPFVALFACLGGWFAAQPLSMYAAAEATDLQFEQACGVNHAQIALAYRFLAAGIAAGSGLIAAVLCASHPSPDSLVSFAAGAMAPSLMPVLIWQVDSRRPLVQALTSLILSFFLATAIIASKAAFLLWPAVLVLLAHQQQKRLAHDQSI